MLRIHRSLALMSAIVVSASSSVASAQSLGTFQWTLQPYCNVLTLNVNQQGAVYRFDGWDDQCGATQRAPVVGTGTLNPDGSVAFGLNIVTAPGGGNLAVSARITLPSVSGTWTDSAGNAGAFALGAITGGSARPGVVVGAGGINPAEVQRRVTGTCAAGQFFTGVNQDGTAVCVASSAGGDLTAVFAGAGLTGGATSGDATLAVDFGGPGSANSAARSDHRHGTGNGNTAVGDGALQGNVSGLNSTAVGTNALQTSTSGTNVAVGFNALRLAETADAAVAVGVEALGHLTTGGNNTGIGSGALNSLQTGSSNAALGTSSLSLATGSLNVAAGSQSFPALTAGDGNVGIGFNVGLGFTSGNNNIYIGPTVSSGSSTENSTIRLGNGLQSRAFIAGIRGVTTGTNDAVAVVIDSNGQLGTVSSSARTKHDIVDVPGNVTDQLLRLRPVQFRYNQAFTDGAQPIQYGLIAEEVQDVMPELVALGKDGTPETVKYHVLPALLLKEVQRQNREIDELRLRLADLERLLAAKPR